MKFARGRVGIIIRPYRSSPPGSSPRKRGGEKKTTALTVPQVRFLLASVC